VLFKEWAGAYPELAALWEDAFSGKLPAGWDADLPSYPAGAKPLATREANGIAINAIAPHIPTFIGGDADLFPSTKTLISGVATFSAEVRNGRNLAYGVREHAMGAITNGLALHGGIIKPYTATFMTFSDYMRPAIRLAALMDIAPIFVFTHDSIGVGEDGPTHQPVEQAAALRAIPGLTVIRPADANETIAAWKVAMQLKGPSALIFSRQKLPIFAPDGVMEGVARGAYIKAEAEGGAPEVLLLSCGSEVEIVMAAREALGKLGIKARVVSMPSWELFEKQDAAYRAQVLPPNVKARVAIEAGVPMGWHRWTGDGGRVIAIERFGASAPQEIVYREFGLTAQAVADAARALLGK
jgi:transketolase